MTPVQFPGSSNSFSFFKRANQKEPEHPKNEAEKLNKINDFNQTRPLIIRKSSKCILHQVHPPEMVKNADIKI